MPHKGYGNWLRWSPLFFVTLLFAVACATVPLTERSQFRLISNKDLVPEANQQFDRMMAVARQKNAVLSASDSPQAASTIALVKRVSDRILDAAGMKDRFNWEITVVKYSEANALVLPSGKIMIFAGLFSIAKSEAGLAAVIGHEVGHVVAQHQAERVSQEILVAMGLQVVDLALVSSNSRYRPLIGAAAGLGALYGIILPFSREHESEADHLGLLYMAKAGYDPSEAIEVWEKMEELSGSGPWEYLSTHPSPATRRAQLLSWMPEAKVLYANQDSPLPSSLSELGEARAEYDHQAAVAPIAPRPSFLSGYWYRTTLRDRTTPLTYRYVGEQLCSERPGVMDTCFVLESETQTQILTQDYAILEGQRKDDKPSSKYSPALKMVDWPLQLGKAWSQDITIELTTGGRSTIKTKGEVVAYESVTVPAGTFMAYKIVFSMNGTRVLQYWYAPEVRNLVRTNLLAVFGLSFMAEEMMDYQKTDEPVIKLRHESGGDLWTYSEIGILPEVGPHSPGTTN